MANYDTENETPKKAVALVFAALTIPFWLSFCERQDCYTSRDTCEKDWNSADCMPHPEPNCPYIGKTYHSYFGRGGGGYHSTGSSIGSTSRGGFGSTGHGFGGGE